jgi:heme-degrading monooxygenase HmoA
MYVAVTTIKMPADQLDRVAAAFRHAAPDMKRFDGFLGLELWRTEDTLQAVSRWASREAMAAYGQSEAFRAHHGGVASGPAGHGAAHPAGHGGAHAASGGGGAHGGGQVVVYEAETVI